MNSSENTKDVSEYGDAFYRLGIMGGTFDPIHVGHLALAQQVFDACSLRSVLFIPAGNPAFKQQQHVTDAQDRLAMCKLAVANNPAFAVSDLEISRSGITYTVDTLRELRNELGEGVELCLIIGADAAETLPQWKYYEAIASLATIILIDRPGQRLAKDIYTELTETYGFRVEMVETTALDISSTALRHLVYQGKSIRYLVPDAVYDYIHAHDLYR